MSDKGERKPRVDAERNRERLLTTAKATFAKKGIDASLEEIARETGVGIGTLYRHFPTRDALVASVYRSEAEQLAAAGRALSTTHTPMQALREWMNLFVDYMTTKHGLLSALDSLVGGSALNDPDTTEQISSTMRMLAERAVTSGDAQLEIDPVYLLRAMAGVAKAGTGGDGMLAARQLIDILIAGIRATNESTNMEPHTRAPRKATSPDKPARTRR